MMRRATRWLLMFVVGSGATLASAGAVVSLVASPFQSPGAGDDVVVAVKATEATGVKSFDLTYAYNSSLLTPTGVFTTGYTHGFALTSNLKTPGVVAIQLASPTALTGSGEVAWVTFHVKPGIAGGTVAPFSWVAASLNGGAIPCGQSGMNLTVGSAVATIATPRGAYGAHGSQVSVPITAEALTGGSAFDLVVTFDPNVLTAISVQPTTFAGCLALVPNVSTPGTVRIALYGLCNLTGSGPLANIVFSVVGANGSRTPMNVTRGGIDEGHYPTVLADGLFNVCGSPDADGDGYSTCAGDCNDTQPNVFPGALESCNGVDDDCDGVVDDAVIPTGNPTLGVVRVGGDAVLTWASVAAATSYDIVRGALSSLAIHSGDFSQSVDFCLGDNLTAPSVVDASIPAADAGYWYLVRPTSCGGPGSYDGTDSAQIAPRDSGIDASPYTCP